MCGRVNVSDHEGVRALLEMMGMEANWKTLDERYNIAPTQRLDVIKLEDEPVVATMSWGVSMTIKGKKGQPIVKRIPNSRDDKVWSSYLWRYLIPEQRVLIPVNGFYEWKRENKKLVQAYYITPVAGSAMFFAGIYKAPKDESQRPEVSIITTGSNDAMSKVHDRMPVIMSSQNEAMAWIQESDKQSLTELMRPASNDALVFTPVSNYVNKSSNEGPECIEPVPVEAQH